MGMMLHRHEIVVEKPKAEPEVKPEKAEKPKKSEKSADKKK